MLLHDVTAEEPGEVVVASAVLGWLEVAELADGLTALDDEATGGWPGVGVSLVEARHDVFLVGLLVLWCVRCSDVAAVCQRL